MSNQIFSNGTQKYVSTGFYPQLELRKNQVTVIPTAVGTKYSFLTTGKFEICQTCLSHTLGVFTCLVPMKLQIHSMIIWDPPTGTAAQQVSSQIQINQSAVFNYISARASVSNAADTTQAVFQSLDLIWDFAAGDTFSLWLFQNTGVALNVLSDEQVNLPQTFLIATQLEA